jgi:hypothetical protein
MLPIRIVDYVLAGDLPSFQATCKLSESFVHLADERKCAGQVVSACSQECRLAACLEGVPKPLF